MSLPLNVRHHQQDDPVSCGRACAQMVIGFEFARLGVVSGTPLPDQAAMANAETGVLGSLWSTEPSELATHINSGLLTFPGAKSWAVVEFKPSPGLTGDPANIEVSSLLLDLVVQKLNAGFPSVVMKGDNDHWETAFDYLIDTTSSPPTTYLYTIDPLPALAAPLATPHSDSDTCERHPDTIWFLSSDSISARRLVCNESPFAGSAISIVQTNPADWWAGGGGGVNIRRGINEVPQSKPTPDPRFRDAWNPRTVIGTIRDPLPPLDKNLPLLALIKFFKRDMWRMLTAMSKLPQPASPLDFDWSRVVVRHAKYYDDQEETMAIVAAPARENKERSLLIAINHLGSVEAMHLTSSAMMIESLASAPDEPLWIVPKYGQWLPFVKVGGDGTAARFRRLYDGFEINLKNEHREKR